jgi:hypothetical protein
MSPTSWRAKLGSLSLALVVFLVSGLGREVFPERLGECRFAWTLTESQRVDRALDALGTDPRAGLPPGHYPRLWAALRDHVPSDAWIAMVSRDGQHRALTHIVLCAVAFPRRFLLLESLPSGWQAKLRSLGQHGFVLEYSTPPVPEVAAACDPVVSGDSFAIWRLRQGRR